MRSIVFEKKMTTQVKLNQVLNGVIDDISQIENYLIAKKWTIDAGQYRSPCGKYGLYLDDGAQLILNSLESIEGRCSNSIYQDIIGLTRNKN